MDGTPNGRPVTDDVVRVLIDALAASDPEAFIEQPERGRRTAIDGCFDVSAVALALLSRWGEGS